MTEATVKYNSIGNPFPGLRAFKGSESHLFFGREEHIADVIRKLETNHFVAVVGTSGTGKSSLIKAGVLPAIESSKKNSNDFNWEVVTITPGSSPLLNLAKAICQNTNLVGTNNKEVFEKKLIELMSYSTLGLVQGMRSVLDNNTRLLILVDQFEEVFRFAEEENAIAKIEYNQFVNLLIETVRQRDVPIYAILTLRSDFLGDCVAFDGLPEAINDGHYLVPRMNKVQMKRAIIGPIDFAEGKISPRLVQHITSDLGTNPDQLPILQHAMMRCWDYWKINEVTGEPMDLKHFEAIGDLGYALSNHANEAFEELTSDQQLRSEKIFKCLTTKKADNRGVRRPLAISHLMKITESNKEDVLASIAPFQKMGRSFILPGSEILLTENTIIDISHESLMRGWDRLKNWVDEEMESSEFYNRICTAALLYQKGASALWRNPELQLALDWKIKQQPILAWGELYNENFISGIDFIEESRKAYFTEGRKKKRRTKVIRFSVAFFILIISILAAWALVQTGVANKKTKEAEVKSKEALDQKFLAEGAKEKALFASNEAMANKLIAERQAKNAAQQAKLADEQKGIAETEKIKAETSAKDAYNKQRLADQKSQEALHQKQQANVARDEALRLRLIATSQNLAHESTQLNKDKELASLLAILSYDIAQSNNGEENDATIYTASSKALQQISTEYSPKVLQYSSKIIAMMLKDNCITFVDNTGTTSIYNSTDLKLLTKQVSGVQAIDIDQAFINPLKNSVALGLNNFALHAFGEGIAEQNFTGHTGLIRAVSFRNSNPSLISGGRDNKLIFWNSNGFKSEILFEARIKAIVCLPNAIDCFIGCENGNVYQVNINDKKQVLFASRPNNRVEVLAQSDDGTIIAIGYSDGLTQVFNNTGVLLKELSGDGSLAFLKIDKKHNLIALANSANLVSIYTLTNLTKIPIEIKLERPIKEMDIDKSTGYLYVYCTDRSIYKYATRSDWYINQLRTKVTRKLTQEEWQTFVGVDIPYYVITPNQIIK